MSQDGNLLRIKRGIVSYIKPSVRGDTQIVSDRGCNFSLEGDLWFGWGSDVDLQLRQCRTSPRALSHHHSAALLLLVPSTHSKAYK